MYKKFIFGFTISFLWIFHAQAQEFIYSSPSFWNIESHYSTNPNSVNSMSFIQDDTMSAQEYCNALAQTYVSHTAWYDDSQESTWWDGNDWVQDNGWYDVATSITCDDNITPPPLPVYGCMDPSATNYNPNATQNNQNSCIYTESWGSTWTISSWSVLVFEELDLSFLETQAQETSSWASLDYTEHFNTQNKLLFQILYTLIFLVLVQSIWIFYSLINDFLWKR